MLLWGNWGKQQILLMPLAVWLWRKTLVNIEVQLHHFIWTVRPIQPSNLCVHASLSAVFVSVLQDVYVIYAHRTHNKAGRWGQAESFHWWHHAGSSTVSKGSNLRKCCHHNNIGECESKLFSSKSLFIHPQNKPNWQKAMKCTVHIHTPQRMKPLWTLHDFFSCTTLSTNCHLSVNRKLEEAFGIWWLHNLGPYFSVG